VTSVNGTLVFALLMVPVVLSLLLLAMPRWLGRSMFKHRLWRLRDQVVDDIIDGKLPRSHPAVGDLERHIEWALGEARSFDMLHLLVWRWAVRKVDPATREMVAKPCSLDGLDAGERAMVEGYRARLRFLSSSAMLCTSWIGLAVVAWLLPHAIRTARRTRRERAPSPPTVIHIAAHEAVESTRLGASSREFVRLKRSLGVNGAASERQEAHTFA
jgi:hypothetical protein